jgi:hypothetical protein
LDVGNYVCVDDSAEVAVNKLLPFATTIHMKDFYNTKILKYKSYYCVSMLLIFRCQ